MLIKCPECGKEHYIDEKKYSNQKKIKIICESCGTGFEISNPYYKSSKFGTTAQAKKFEEIEYKLNKDYYIYVLKGAKEGEKFKLDKPFTVIGRDNSADIVIPDPEVSRKHCMIEIYKDKVILKDLNSTNGTFINEEKIESIEIVDQTEFKIGKTTILFIEAQKNIDII